MAIFNVDIEKKLGAEYWTNIYHIDAADLSTAASNAGHIVTAEVAIHHESVYFTKMRVSEQGNPGNFISAAVNTYGLATGEANLMPLFVVQVVDFTPTVGRSSKKYLRGLLREDLVNMDAVSPTYVNGPVQDYADDVMDTDGICDEHGNSFSTAKGSEITGMRQLRRGSKRRAAPVLP